MRTVCTLAACALLPFTLSACALLWKDRFRVVYDAPDAVVLQYDPAIPVSREKMQARADALCGRFEKSARYARTQKKHFGVGLYAAFFDCIDGDIQLVEPEPKPEP